MMKAVSIMAVVAFVTLYESTSVCIIWRKERHA